MTANPAPTPRALCPVKHVTLEGLPWEYRAAGADERAGLLLLGSELGGGDALHCLIELFEADFRVIAPCFPEAPDVEALLSGLERLLDSEGLPTVSVFGHGFGAGLAHALARRAPGRIEALALSGMGIPSMLHALSLRAHAATARVLPTGSLVQHYQRQFERLATDAGQRSDALRAQAEKMIGRHSARALRQRFSLYAQLFGHPDAFGFHHRVADPAQVLLLLAADDPAFSREEQAALVRSYATPTVTRYVNGGHWIGLLPAREFERKLKVHFSRFAGVRRAARARPAPQPIDAPLHPDADTLDWRTDRRLG